MSALNGRAAAIEALRYGRFPHPDARVHGRLEALAFAQSTAGQGGHPAACGMSKASVHRDLNAYVSGGLEQVKPRDHARPHSQRPPSRSTRAASVREHPPATVAEAAAQSPALTGMTRRPTQVRQCLNALGMKPRRPCVRPFGERSGAFNACWARPPLGGNG
jgi:hypothetical protein